MVEEKPSTAFMISLVGGILILLGSMAMALMVNMGVWWMGISGGRFMMMGSFSLTSGIMYALIAFGAICGVAILIASFMLNARPRETATWGAVILIFSILSFMGMGGFFLGAVLGIVGGALALGWPVPGQDVERNG